MAFFGYLHDKIKSAHIQHKWFLRAICAFAVVVVSRTLVCAVIPDSSEMFLSNSRPFYYTLFDNNWQSFASFVACLSGLIGFCYLGYVVFLFAARQNVLDRYLAEFKFISVVKIIIFILCIPCTVALAISVMGVLPTDLITSSTELLDSNSDSPDIFWSTFYHFADPGNQHMVGSALGRRVAWWIALLGMFLMNGFLVTTIISFIDRHIIGWINGEVRYHFWKSPHIIIIGGHDSVPSIIKNVLEPMTGKYRDVKHVVILTNREISVYRTELKSLLPIELYDKVVLYHGMRSSKDDIESLNIAYQSLRAVYIVGEGTAEKTEAAHDSLNLECAKLVAYNRGDVHKEKKNDTPVPDKCYLECYVMFEKQASYASFQLTDTAQDLKKSLLFIPYNYYEMVAERIMANPQKPYKAIDIHYDEIGNPKEYMDESSEKRVHIIIIGMSRMGLAMGQEAALICHYPNYAREEWNEELAMEAGDTNVESKKGDLRTLITYIDSEAYRQMISLQNRCVSYFEISPWSYYDATVVDSKWKHYRGLNEDSCQYKHLAEERLGDKNFLDVEWEFIQGTVGEPSVNRYLEKCAERDNEILTLYVTMPNDDESLTVAAYLPQKIYDKAEQILVHQRQSDEMIKQLSAINLGNETQRSNSRYKKIVPFGVSDCIFEQRMVDVPFAKKINSKNIRRISEAIKEGKSWKTIDLVWHELSLRDRWSAIYSSHGWRTRFRTLGTNPGEIPALNVLEENFANDEDLIELYGRVEHNRWCCERLLKMGENLMSQDNYFRWFSMSTDPKNHGKSEQDLLKNVLKDGPSREHLDFCSNYQLRKRDPVTIYYDTDRNKRIIDIYQALFDMD